MRKILMAESSHMGSAVKVGSHHYAELFSQDKNNKILYLSNPVSPFHWLKREYRENTRDRFKIWLSGGRWYNENLFTYIPLTLIPSYNVPLLNSRWAASNTLRCTIPPLKKLLKKKGFDKVDILFLSNINFHLLLHSVKADLIIHRITDDISGFSAIPDYSKYVEEELINKADIVIVTSQPLLREVGNIRKDKVFCIPNGVDYQHFNRGNSTCPPEYEHIPLPRIVYVGAIEYWFDIDLLKYCAEKLPDYSFVLIGPSMVNLSELSHFKNVFILGKRDYNLIPDYLKNANVGIIPFKRTKLFQSVSPIKLYEYMACGLPVVSVESETLVNLNSPTFLAGNEFEFVQALERALKLSNYQRNELFKFAQENTWEKRFAKLNELIAYKLGSRRV